MTDDDLIGQQLDEYQIEALLGSGGMARVYRALDGRLRRYVALKVIDTPYQADSDYLSRFQREGQAIARLEHPHIVHLYRYGEAQGLLYMAMQYVNGADLHFVLDSYHQDGQLIEPEEAGRIIGQVCSALDYAHGQGVVHRDVKPANILLDKQGEVLLSDFGLALLTEIGTRGEVFGSPHYVAPEQAISSAGAVPQSDQYSVGVILYEMFTGHLPFDASEALDIAMKHMSEAPPLPSSIRPDLDPGVEAVILKALSKTPGDRYPTCAALANALESVLGHTKPHPPVVGQLTIPQRVKLEVEANPLPPIPAEISQESIPPAPVTYEEFPSERVSYQEPTVGVESPFERIARFPWVTCASIIAVVICVALAFLLAGMWLGRDRNGDAALAEQTRTAEFRSTTAAGAAGGAPGATAASLEETLRPTPTQFFPGGVPGIEQPALTPTLFVAPSLAATATATAPTASPEVYTLLFATAREDSLFIMNLSPDTFPLSLLRVGDGDGRILGSEWGLEGLPSGACVAAWKDGGNPDSPNINCQPMGDRLTRAGSERFWKNPFNIYFGDTLITNCRDRCEVIIPRD